ncbi:fused PTS fructose transporter subunit IIA/HPr protein [Parasalinivibrio latis]|uniref:fused PTS fructose transporter subunit IIA/HPr protein n=1 Tax=Parasalinivibrio latis TaxID=2952610 RepID=UPI0030DFFE06
MLQVTQKDIVMGQQASTKQDAISQIAAQMVSRELVAEGYGEGMLAREAQSATFLGNGIAIPHGTTDTRDKVKQTGLQIFHFPDGVAWGDDGQQAYLAIGIAAGSDEHLGVLKQLTKVLSADGVEEKLKNAANADEIIAVLQGGEELMFEASLVETGFPARSLLELTAVAGGKLRNAGAVEPAFVADMVSQQAVHLGQGLWLVSGSSHVNNTAMAFVSAEDSVETEQGPVRGVLAVAGKDGSAAASLEHLAALVYTNKLDALFSGDAANVVKLLSQAPAAKGNTRIFTIKNPHGLHARPGAVLVATVKKFESKVWVSNLTSGSAQVNAKSLMKVIGLGVTKGHELEFVAEGPDADAALDAIGQAIDAGLGEG